MRPSCRCESDSVAVSEKSRRSAQPHIGVCAHLMSRTLRSSCFADTSLRTVFTSATAAQRSASTTTSSSNVLVPLGTNFYGTRAGRQRACAAARGAGILRPQPPVRRLCCVCCRATCSPSAQAAPQQARATSAARSAPTRAPPWRARLVSQRAGRGRADVVRRVVVQLVQVRQQRRVRAALRHEADAVVLGHQLAKQRLRQARHAVARHRGAVQQVRQQRDVAHRGALECAGRAFVRTALGGAVRDAAG